MRTSILLTLALAALGSTAFAAPKSVESAFFRAVKDLGNVMYVGDDHTQGVGSASYRWPLFKIWVDNGIAHKEVGINSGNYAVRRSKSRKFMYAGKTFYNIHSAIAAERACDVSGRQSETTRFEGTNIFDWLGLDKSYTGYRRIDAVTQKPDSYFVMLGLNDTLRAAGKAGIGSCIAAKQESLLGKGGDMDIILKAMRRSNPDARIAVLTLPAWAPGRIHNQREEDHAAIAQYNARLKEWGRARKVAVIDVNRGLVDVSSGAFKGVAALFHEDKLHTTAQSELIISGNIAQQLGYAGRTAGLKRWPASEFPLHASAFVNAAPDARAGKRGGIEFRGNFSYSAPVTHAAGSTLEFRFAGKGYGNGASGGWIDDKTLTINLTAAGQTGTLSLGESSLRWGDGWGVPLYSADMSTLDERIRVSYVQAVPEQSREGGFYVWLGDMLIGEALQGTPAAEGAKLEISAHSLVRFARLDYDPEQSWAPDTRRYSNGNPLIKPAAAKTAKLKPVTEKPEAEISDTEAAEAAAPRTGFSLCSSATSGNVHTVLRAADSAPPAAPEGLPQQKVNALCLSSLGGSASLTIDESYSGRQIWSPLFAAYHCKGISGDATLEVNSPGFRVQGDVFWGERCALVGSIKASIGGALRYVLRKGEYNGNIFGGPIGLSHRNSVGSTYIELGDVRVAGNVYAGGAVGVIKGDAAIVLDGAARLDGQLVCAGGNMNVKGLDGGKIMGKSSITLSNVGAGSSMAEYAGQLSGGRNVEGVRRLVLNHVTAGKLRASLCDFDEIHVTNGSKVTLDNLGGATKLVVDESSQLSLASGTYEAAIHNAGRIELVRGCNLTLREPGSEGSGKGRYVVRKGAVLNTGKVKHSNIIRS